MSQELSLKCCERPPSGLYDDVTLDDEIEEELIGIAEYEGASVAEVIHQFIIEGIELRKIVREAGML